MKGSLDSPLTVNCTGKGAGRVLQEISRHAEQVGPSPLHFTMFL